MDADELPTDGYRTLLLSATRDISTISMDKKMAATLVEQTVDSVTGWVVKNGPPIGEKVLFFIGVLLIFYLAARLAREVTAFGLRRSRIRIPFPQRDVHIYEERLASRTAE